MTTKRDVKAKQKIEAVFPGGKFTKTGEGKEKVKVGGKDVDAQWYEGTFESDQMKGSTSKMKTWFSSAIPGGLCKMTMEMDMQGQKMMFSGEHVESGTAK